MASKCSRIFNGASISSLKSAIKSKSATSSSLPKSSLPPKQPSSSPISRFTLSRVPSELGGVQSLLPLHSAVATARMTSCLSLTSRRCAALLQGLEQPP
ncbi:hypothetical protein Leryth_014805 [Lithospermum erythrorhizon]|uniref:Uncharacterized protein n=1 Tax=Lithospermum erythrorhizon TaxID=34254 RepID=A0AAV3S3N1_LITER|nr:hypothetical protein Leryth_014805 [Lithospermum erythrorhizon]